MKVTIKYIKCDENKNNHRFFEKFIKFLNKKVPLNSNLKIEFLGERVGDMTTGSRLPNYIKVLTKNRMNRDICRTLAHEWVHEYQIDVLKRPLGPNIGGKNEDEANSFAGQLIKMFEKEYPDLEETMYE